MIVWDAELGNGNADDLDRIIIFHFLQIKIRQKLDHIQLRYSSNSTVGQKRLC